MSKVAFWTLWCFVAVLPWDALTRLPVLGSIPRLVGIVASAVGIAHVLGRRRIRPLSWFLLFAMLFVLWTGVTGFWSIDPEATRARVVTYVQLVILAWLIWEIAWSPERQRALLLAYVLGASVAAVATISNYLSGVPVAPDIARFVALKQDPNELGLTLALGLPMAWYLSLSQPYQRLAWVWRLYLPLAVTALLLTASRGAFLAALVGLLIIPWTLERLRPGTKLALYGVAVGTFLLAINFVPDASLQRIRSTRADIAAGHFGGRGAIWMAGLEVAREHPLAGVGAGGFEKAVEPALQGEWAPHQVPLSILVEDGIVGLCLFLAMVAAAMKPVRHLPALQQRFSIILLFSLGVGSLSIHWDNRKQFWFVLGILAAQVAPAVGVRASSRVRVAASDSGVAASNS